MSDFPVVLSNVVDGPSGTEILSKFINNLEAKVGIDSSAVTTSLDYKVAHRLEVISVDTTITVKTSGGDFTTVLSAYQSLKSKWINSDVTVTIEIDDELWTENEIDVYHPCSSQILLKGKNVYTKTISSVQSSSGSSGAWSIIINLDSVTNIAVNDYVIIHTASGGTKPTFIEGCHLVTNVDGVNNRITITSKHQHATAPSGAVNATVVIPKTRITVNNWAIFYSNSALNLKDLVLIAGSGQWCGIYGSSAQISLSRVGVSGFDNGIMSGGGAVNLVDKSAISGCGEGVYLNNNCGGALDDCVISGCSGDGVLMETNAGILLLDSKPVITGNAKGINISTAGSGRIADATFSGNTTAIYAEKYGYVKVDAITLSDNGTDYNPTVNTQGNEYGYIDI